MKPTSRSPKYAASLNSGIVARWVVLDITHRADEVDDMTQSQTATTRVTGFQEMDSRGAVDQSILLFPSSLYWEV